MSASDQGAAGRPVLSLVSGLASEARRNRLMVMLQAYFDDSEVTGPAFAVLAGFVSSAERWAAFSDEWKGILQIPPALEYCKSKEAWALNRQFSPGRGWCESLRDERMQMLRDVIKRHAMIGIASIIQMREFKALNDPAHPLGASPYWILFYRIIATCCEWQADNGMREPTDFIFDEQGGESFKALSCWNTFYNEVGPDYRARIARRQIHDDDKKLMPLQAGDLLAWL